MANTINNLNNFQKRVFDEYKLIKGFEISQNRINETRLNKKNGCLTAPVSFLADLFVGKILQSEQQKRDYSENMRKAKDYLNQKEIIDKICNAINTDSKARILTEEEFTNKLTEILFQSETANKYAIPENHILYALMSVEIINLGVESFCQNQER
jgi:hypothetical protein